MSKCSIHSCKVCALTHRRRSTQKQKINLTFKDFIAINYLSTFTLRKIIIHARSRKYNNSFAKEHSCSALPILSYCETVSRSTHDVCTTFYNKFRTHFTSTLHKLWGRAQRWQGSWPNDPMRCTVILSSESSKHGKSTPLPQKRQGEGLFQLLVNAWTDLSVPVDSFSY